MTLRTRLLLVVVGIVLVGLLVSGVVTYKSLQSFLLTRLDQQLENAPSQAARVLSRCSPPAFTSGTYVCHSDSLPSVPTGTFGELRVAGEPTVSGWFLGSSQSPPSLPADMPVSTQQSPSIFTVTNKNGVTYQAIAEQVDLSSPIGPQIAGTIIVAVPLTDVDQTLGRLLWVEILVSAAVLLVLGAASWWIVKAGLRPLDEMTETAGAIAAGDLSQRVAASDTGTEVGRLGVALNVMLGEIEESFAARKASEERLRRFLADASHELRTPLTSIRGYAEMFDRGARDRPDDLATSMRHIRADADRMSTLVEDLLVLARLGRERPLAHEIVDMRQLVEPAVADIAVQAPDREIEVKGPEHCVVVGDSNRLRQVVDNLLVNAVRHTPPGTPVEVEVAENSGSCVVSVLDRGQGIPPELQERIFEPFFRADPSRSRATGGEGLGLAIVSTIVGAHGGQVGVSPREGGGSRFWVRLPLAPPVGSNGSSEASGTDHEGHPTPATAIGSADPASNGDRRVPVVAPSTPGGGGDAAQS